MEIEKKELIQETLDKESDIEGDIDSTLKEIADNKQREVGEEESREAKTEDEKSKIDKEVSEKKEKRIEEAILKDIEREKTGEKKLINTEESFVEAVKNTERKGFTTIPAIANQLGYSEEEILDLFKKGSFGEFRRGEDGEIEISLKSVADYLKSKA